MHAKPSYFTEFEKSKQNQLANGSTYASDEDFAQLFAKLIVKTAKDIDILIDSLPSEESTPELQSSHLRKLEIENQEEAQRLEETVKKGEKLLEQIQSSLQDIAESQLNEFKVIQQNNL